MEQKEKWKYFRIAILLSAAIAVILHFPLVTKYLFDYESSEHRHHFMVSFTHLGMELFITFLVALLMFILNFLILYPIQKHERLSSLRVILSVILTFSSVTILNHFFYSIKELIDPQPWVRGHRAEFDLRNFFVSTLVIGSVLIIRLIFQKQTIILENETLRREALQSQFESLKNQLSPHFLFNSLTALKILINEKPDVAQNYVNSLSKALRYTLQSNEKQLVTLQEEMNFMESYLFLIKMRFDTNLTVLTHIPDSHLLFKIPPLTIQTLVENAIKHNEISKKNPLTISILVSDEDTLVVINPIQMKLTQQEGTGIGLSNLSKQFMLLIGQEIKISRENNRFKVEVSLIK